MGAGVVPRQPSDAMGVESGILQQLIHAQRDRLTPIWVRSHQDEPLNEGADALARLTSRYATGTSELKPAAKIESVGGST